MKAIILALLMLAPVAARADGTAKASPATQQFLMSTSIRFSDQFSGSTLDVQLKNALASLPAAGGNIMISPGAHTIAGSVYITNQSNIGIEGAPGSTITVQTGGYSVFIVSGTSSDIAFKGLNLIAPSADNTTAVYISTSASGSRMIFRENTLSGFSHGVTISSDSFNDCNIGENVFKNFVGNTSGHAAIYTISRRNTISGNKFINMPRHDIYLSGDLCSLGGGARDNAVVGNTSVDNQIEAIAIYATSAECPIVGNTIKGNVIVNPKGIAVGLDQQATGNTVGGNTIVGATGVFGSGQGLIELLGSTAVGTWPQANVIIGNSISSSTGNIPIIYSQNASYNLITNNTIEDCTGVGIEVVTTGGVISSGTVVSGNVIRNTPGALQGNGDNALVNTFWINNTFTGSASNLTDSGVNTVYAGNSDGTNAGFNVKGTASTVFSVLADTLAVTQGGIVSAKSQPEIKLTRTSSQNIPDSTATPYYWSTIVTNEQMGWDVSVSSDAVVIPTGGDGEHAIICAVSFPAGTSGTGTLQLEITINGTLKAVRSIDNSVLAHSLAISDSERLAAGDAVRCVIWQTSGAKMAVGDGGAYNFFVVKKDLQK